MKTSKLGKRIAGIVAIAMLATVVTLASGCKCCGTCGGDDDGKCCCKSKTCK